MAADCRRETHRRRVHHDRTGVIGGAAWAATSLMFALLTSSAVARPIVKVSTVALDFGTQESGAISAPDTLKLTNTGDAPLLVERLTLAGDNAAAFALINDQCSRASLQPGQSCTVAVQFQPTAAVPQSATLSILDNAPDSPQIIRLNGVGSPRLGPGAAACLQAGVPVLLDFEAALAGDTVFNQFDGVAFEFGDARLHSGSWPITVVQPLQGTASGTQAVQAAFQDPFNRNPPINLPQPPLLVSPSGSHLVLRFDQPQCHVSLSTGLAIAPPLLPPELGGAQGSGGFSMLLQGFDDSFVLPVPGGAIDGVPVASSETACLGPGPSPISTPLAIDDTSGRIRYAVLSLVPCSRVPGGTDSGPGGANLGPSSTPIMIDNLSYGRPLRPTAHEHDPPIVTITTPANGSTVTGTIPGALSQALEVDVQESDLRDLAASVNGQPSFPLSFFNVGPNRFHGYGTMNDNSGLHSGTNTVTVTATDFDLPGNTGAATSTFTFQMLPPPPPSPTALVVPTAFEVTQSIDSGPQPISDANRNPVSVGNTSGEGFTVTAPALPPLIQGKATLVRVYGAVTGSAVPVQHVPAAADVVDLTTGATLATALAPVTAPMMPLGPPTPTSDGIPLFPLGTTASDIVLPPGDQPLPPGDPRQPGRNPNVDSLARTWNFYLPADWTNHDLLVSVRVNDGRYSDATSAMPVPECGAAQGCMRNHDVDIHIHFQSAPTITCNPVLLHVVGSFNGNPVNALPTESQIETMIAVWNEMYPERVVRGTDMTLTISPTDDSDGVLEDVDDLDCCGSDTTFDLGLYPGGCSPGTALGGNELSGGVCTGGKAWVGDRGAWANSNAPFDAAHEIGHNIGFDHWACENRVTDDECGVFPIPHGGIGAVITDIANWQASGPGDETGNTAAQPHWHDFMTYGSFDPGHLGFWVSTYTYNLLLQHGGGVGSYDTNDPPALLVRGRIDPQNGLALKPVYQVLAPHPVHDAINEDDPAAMATLQGYDAQGNLLFVHNFEPLKVSDHRTGIAQMQGIREYVPPVAGMARLAVTRRGRLLGELRVPTRKLQVSITSPAAGANWPAGKPQTIQWTATADPAASPPLMAQVQYSPDGQSRVTLGRDIANGSLTVDPDQLSGSDHAMFYVQVSDGLNRDEVAFGPFTVAPKPPSVHIISPSSGLTYPAHAPLTLQATGFDRQETLTDGQFVWSSDRDGMIGSGRELTTLSLSPGDHALTVSATDGRGLTSKDSVMVHIQPVPGAVPPTKGMTSVSVKSVAGAPGAVVPLEIDADALAQNLAGAEITLQVGGPGVVDTAGLARGSLISGDRAQAAASAPEGGPVKISLLGSSPRNGPGSLAILPLKIAPGALPGVYPLTLTQALLADATGRPIPDKTVPGQLTVLPAGGPQAGSLTLGSGTGYAGRSVALPLNADAKGLAGVTFTLQFDPSLTLLTADVQPGGLLAAAHVAFNGAVPGQARVSVLGEKAAAGPGVLAMLSFHLPAAAAPGTVYPIAITGAVASSATGTPMNLGLQHGEIRVLARQLGDVNGEGKLSIAGATLALRFALGLAQPTADQLAAGDLKGAGALTIADVTRILRAALGLQPL